MMSSAAGALFRTLGGNFLPPDQATMITPEDTAGADSLNLGTTVAL
jgi:hypothetical protein